MFYLLDRENINWEYLFPTKDLIEKIFMEKIFSSIFRLLNHNMGILSDENFGFLVKKFCNLFNKIQVQINHWSLVWLVGGTPYKTLVNLLTRYLVITQYH